MESYVNKPATG
uniref:Uncharacterized protein n=1 Tax=Arundo donax TaxID=35708 RepID=A0A0A9B0S9_ARUDO